MTWLEEAGRPERLPHGHVIVLPGIEGYSRWNRSIVRGLQSAGLPHAMEIHDWTFGRWQSLRSLRSRRRHDEQSQRIADKIMATHDQYPDAPVWLIGHSGGGAMCILALERLLASQRIAGAILLAPALSPHYPLATALDRTRYGIWNFSSWADAFFLIFGTLVMGTIDGRHSISAGACGFREGGKSRPGDADSRPQLTEVPWRREMLADRHLAGHFGPVHNRFVERWIAPIIQQASVPVPPKRSAGTLFAARGNE
ncbi:MAG: alpha/beta fold hydrolase [Planctomycetaceae bacterium]